MNSYETSTTVGQQGDIHLAGLPFQPGIEVEVFISARASTMSAPDGDAAAALLAALDHAHNSQPVGPLNREALYDRNNIH